MLNADSARTFMFTTHGSFSIILVIKVCLIDQCHVSRLSITSTLCELPLSIIKHIGYIIRLNMLFPIPNLFPSRSRWQSPFEVWLKLYI